ncbi:MAG TPA: hypothetical protein VHE56_07605, partial [Mycobacteriales bacterium]|nr:hypothetical protein [Mycobacteriales bacterium]
GVTPAQLVATLGPVEAQLVQLLSGGTEACPTAGSVSSPVSTPAGRGASVPGGGSDLARLLVGLGGSQ